MYERTDSISETQGHRDLRQTLRHRRARRNGAGTFLLPLDRHHHQHRGCTVSPVLPDLTGRNDCRYRIHRRRPCLRNVRSRYGNRHRLGAPLPAPRALFANYRGLCLECARRRRRPARRALCRGTRGGMRQGGLQGDQGRYSADPARHDCGGSPLLRAARADARQGSHESR